MFFCCCYESVFDVYFFIQNKNTPKQYSIGLFTVQLSFIIVQMVPSVLCIFAKKSVGTTVGGKLMWEELDEVELLTERASLHR